MAFSRDAGKDRPLYVCMLSLHGLVRGREPELGRDADTGGQVLYVLEETRALAVLPEVSRVDLVTRLIEDSAVSPDYAVEREPLVPGAEIVRLRFGPPRYLRKEVLWPHLDVAVDRLLQFFHQQRRIPDLVHGHYADAGYVARELSRLLGVPQIHTSHALGRLKRSRLLDTGMRPDSIERQFNMVRRVGVEEVVLRDSSLVVVGTRSEYDDHVTHYDNARHASLVQIPPGTDTERFHPPRREWRAPAIRAEIDRFLTKPAKPLILAISRPAKGKNVVGLLEAYGGSKELRDASNLVLILGSRDDISAMEDNPRDVFTSLLLAIDRLDLYGKVSMPKRHGTEDVPEIYRLAFKRRGVLVNTSTSELFGLTLIEAAASGLPVVATRHGGPPDIVANCRNGLLVDPHNADEIVAALLHALRSRDDWKRWSVNGIRGVARHYTWPAHAQRYLREVRRVLRRHRKRRRRWLNDVAAPTRSRLPTVDRLLVADLDDTLLGDSAGLGAFVDHLAANRVGTAFGIATGRAPGSAMRLIRDHGVPPPDVLIAAVGSEIYYGRELAKDEAWARHIRADWRREAVAVALEELPGMRLQPKQNQRDLKLSYTVDPRTMPTLVEIRRALRRAGLKATIIFSRDRHLDFLPLRASKGRAIRYLSYRWGFPLDHILVAGDSGNDEEMLRGDTLGVVVGNHSPELDRLRGGHQVLFSKGSYAWGILEAIDHYEFFPPA